MIRTVAVLALSLATLTPANASPLRSPWDTDPVALTDTPYTCPAIPSIGRDLTTDGFYRLDDPTHSIIDPVREAAYKASADPVKKAGTIIVAAADAYRTTGSRAAAQCVVERTFSMAQAQSLTGKMSSNQAYYVQGWIAGAIAIAYLKVRTAHLATPEQNKLIGSWLLAVNSQTTAYYDRDSKRGDVQNNHFYWAGIQSTAIGTVANDKAAFDWGIGTYKNGVSHIRPDGVLPREMERGTRALHYHLYALAPLVLLAEFGEANGDDLYALNHGSIHKLVKLSVDGMVDPAFFAKATGIKQETSARPSGDQIGWAPPYQRRFPNPTLAHFIADAPSLSVPYLGGLPPK